MLRKFPLISRLTPVLPECLALPGLMLMTAILYAACTDSQVVGFLHDDGVYIATARAIAEGRGFVIPYLPDMPAQVKYPLLYPLLLSLVWLFQPKFPANLPLMHQFTTMFAIAALPLLYFYLRRVRQLSPWVSLLIFLLTFSQFHFIFYATALMSEAPYFFLSLLTLTVAEADSPDRQSLRRELGLALLSALAFHTRTIGLTLIAAIFISRLLNKQWKNGAVYLSSALCLTVVPWWLWIQAHAPARVDTFNYPLAYVYGGYGLEYGVNLNRDPAGFLHALLEKGVQPLLETLFGLLFPLASFGLRGFPLLTEILSLAIGGLFLILGVQAIFRYRSHMQTGLSGRAKKAESVVPNAFLQNSFSISGIYVGLYFAVLAVWMYPNQIARFLAVVLPWLWLAVFRFFSQCAERLPTVAAKRIACGMGLLLTGWLSLWPAVQGYKLLHELRSSHALEPSGRYADLWSEYQSLFAYIRSHVPRNERIAGIWDPALYLYTEHPSFMLFASALQPVGGQFGEASFARLYGGLRHYDVRYVLSEPFMLNQEVQAPVNPVVENLKKLYPQSFQPIYRSPRGRLILYRVEASPSSNDF